MGEKIHQEHAVLAGDFSPMNQASPHSWKVTGSAGLLLETWSVSLQGRVGVGCWDPTLLSSVSSAPLRELKVFKLILVGVMGTLLIYINLSTSHLSVWYLPVNSTHILCSYVLIRIDLTVLW